MTSCGNNFGHQICLGWLITFRVIRFLPRPFVWTRTKCECVKNRLGSFVMITFIQLKEWSSLLLVRFPPLLLCGVLWSYHWKAVKTVSTIAVPLGWSFDLLCVNMTRLKGSACLCLVRLYASNASLLASVVLEPQVLSNVDFLNAGPDLSCVIGLSGEGAGLRLFLEVLLTLTA